MLLRSGDGRVERLDTAGFPLGMLDASEYDQGEVLLQPGDAVLCVSDGISEATNAKDEMWAESEVVKIVRTCRGLTAQQMIDLLVEATDRFAGKAKQADDMTVVAIRV
jgi:sigma-B regulation protein RsbU (phosphoserine phosphatase)